MTRRNRLHRQRPGKPGYILYGISMFDFLAALVIPVNTWYIFPINELASKGDKLKVKNSVTVYPGIPKPYHPSNGGPKRKKEKFREAWQLFDNDAIA